MSKGILVIDKVPEYCDEHCRFCDSFFNCQFVGDVEEAWRNKQRDSKCPIKPLPKEKEDESCNDYDCFLTHFQGGVGDKTCYMCGKANGYNECLDEIIG